MVHAKNDETASTLLKLRRKNSGLFFPDTVYIHKTCGASVYDKPLWLLLLKNKLSVSALIQTSGLGAFG